jgi:hypothetical protein
MDFLSELINQVYSEVTQTKTVFGIYPGRFQPPGPHHFKTYQWMVQIFGRDNVFITTSDKVESPDSPFNFSEKKEIWEKYGVPSNRIIKVKSPYQSTEVLDLLPKGSSVVFGFGQKDAERFNVGKKKDGSPSFLQWYESNKDNLEDFTKRAYLIILPHNSLKVDNKELSGTEIRGLLRQDPSEEMFRKIFGWYDQKIQSMVAKKLGGSQPITEGGNIFGDVSMVRRENLDATIKSVLEKNGLKDIPYSKIGNISKPIMGDIDISIDTKDIISHLGLPPTATKDELFKAIETKIPNAKPVKGLNQFHLLGEIPRQPFISSDGTEKEGPASAQIDVMLGNRQWREKWYSGAPNSQYKAIFRNLFIAEIFATVIEDEGIDGIKRKHMVTPAEGFFIQRFTIDPKGKKKELSRELKSTDMDVVAKILFGESKTFKDIDTFEKVYVLFNSKDFSFPEYRTEILKAFKENMAKSQSSNPDIKHPQIDEGKMHIQRFSGPNEMSNVEFLQFLQKIQPMVKNGKLDLSVSDTASVTEKLDASPCNWGYNSNGEFFMESANSGEITLSQVERFNNPFTSHFYEALKFLSSYQPFQKRARMAHRKFGSYKIASEMFPVLTHKGDELGDVVFCSTKYNKSNLGNMGAFACFSAIGEAHGEADSDHILDIVESVHDTEWKVYNVNKHGSLSKQGLVFDVSGIQDLVENPQKLQSAIELIKNKKNDPEKDALKKIVEKTKVELQSVLNQYAEQINTFLSSDSSRKYPVEGVVLKVKLPNEDVFVKGTSQIFHKIAEKTWGTRKAAGELEKVFEGNFLKNVLGLTTSHAASLNKIIASAKEQYGTGDEAMNKIALHVYNQLKDSNIDVSEFSLKQRADEAIKTATSEFKNTVSKWTEVKQSGEVDPDTIGKTDSQLKFLGNRLASIRDAVQNAPYTGINYIIYLLRLFIDKRMKQSTDNS